MLFKETGASSVAKVCVLGGAGFLGSHVCDALSWRGHQVVVFDRHVSPWLASGQKMIVGDITDLDCVRQALEGCQFVFNFAALADIGYCIDNPINTASVNVLGAVNVMQAALENDVEKHFFASSVYVSGNSGGYYRCSKIAGEQFAEEYFLQSGLRFAILRFGSLYGPRCGPDNGIMKILTEAISSGKIIYGGDPGAVREYISVHDAANACVALLDDDCNNSTFIIAGSQRTKVSDLLEMLREMLSIENDIEYLKRDGSVGHYIRTPHHKRLSLPQKINFDRYVDFDTGLSELIDNIRTE